MKKMIISICAVCTLLAVCIMVGCEKPLMVNEETDVVKGNLTVTVFEIAKRWYACKTGESDERRVGIRYGIIPVGRG